jgi:hypothetical protein
MNALDILYTPLDTPPVPKTDITKLLSWVETYRKTQVHPNRLDASKIKEVSASYPWNLIYPKIGNNWCHDFNTEFPELADFFSSAYKINESDILNVVLLPVKSEFTGLGFWHSDPDTAGLRCYIENQEKDNDFLLIRPTIEPYNARPGFGVLDPEFKNTPLQDVVLSAKLREPNQTFYLNNVRAVHAVKTQTTGILRIAVIVAADITKVRDHVSNLVVESAKKYSDYALYWNKPN